MKIPRLFTLWFVIAAMLALMVPRSAQAEEISFDFFYETLDPYGEWINSAQYGYCWRPAAVDEDWSPYTDGYWTYTDAGWTWVSYEDWGDICYHYGRWVNLEGEGWCWVPDYEWGPAWVSWRHSHDYVGWAPLPPEVHFRREVGISVWVDSSYDIGPGYYNFCDVEDFGAPVIRSVIFPRTRNVTIIADTVNITNISYNHSNNVVFCGGPRFEVISSRSRHPVPTLKLVQYNNINVFNTTVINQGGRSGSRRAGAAVQRGNTLQVFAPTVIAPTQVIKPRKATKLVAETKVNKGWGVVADPSQRVALQQTLKAQTKGLTPEVAPAKAVEASQLKPVPEKADLTAPSPVIAERRPGKGGKGDSNPQTGVPQTLPKAPSEKAPVAGGVPQTLPKAPVSKPEAVAGVPTEPKNGKPGREVNPTAVPSTEEKPNRKGQRPTAGQPGLKPFNPVEDPARPVNPRKEVAPTVGVPEAPLERPEKPGMVGRTEEGRPQEAVRPGAGKSEKGKGRETDPTKDVKRAQEEMARQQNQEQQRQQQLQRPPQRQSEVGEVPREQKIAPQERLKPQARDAADADREQRPSAQEQQQKMQQRQREEGAGQREQIKQQQQQASDAQREQKAAQQEQMKQLQRQQQAAEAQREQKAAQQEQMKQQQRQQQAAEAQREQKAAQQEQLKQQQRQQQAAGEARAQQQQKAAEAQQRAAQQQQQVQRPPARPQPSGGGGGGSQPRGKGGRPLTPEEAAALQGR